MDRILFFKEEINDAINWLKDTKNPPAYLNDNYKLELERIEGLKEMGWPGEKPSENSYYSLRTCSSWTTSWVIYCLIEYLRLEKDPKAININYLVDPISWLIKARNDNKKDKINYGGWPDFRFDESICESTSWAIIALTQYYELINTMEKEDSIDVKEAIKDGVIWLLENRNDNGGWGFWRDDRRKDSSYTGGSRTYTTSFAMIALLKSLKLDVLKDEQEKIKRSLENGLNWLTNNCREGWGFGENDERNPAGTSFALLAVAEYYEIIKEKYEFKTYEKALEYLKTELNDSWESAFETNAVEWTEKINPPDQTIEKRIRRNFRWDYFTTTYAIVALMKFSEKGPFSYEVFGAAENLADSQMKGERNEGAWGLKLNKNEDTPRIWCTANALWTLLMLNKYLDIDKHTDKLVTHFKKIISARDEVLGKYKVKNERLEDWLKIISDYGEPYQVPILKKAYTTSNGLWYVATLLPILLLIEWFIIEINLKPASLIFILTIATIVSLFIYARYQEKQNEIVLAVIILWVLGITDIIKGLIS